jgi:hypothetical protein
VTRPLTWLVTAVIAMVAACGAPGSGSAVRLENATTVPVAVHLNDAWVGTYPAGAIADVPIGQASIPVVIEARSPSGAVLASLTAAASDMADARGVAEWVLPCGAIRLSLSTAQQEPIATPEPAADTCP